MAELQSLQPPETAPKNEVMTQVVDNSHLFSGDVLDEEEDYREYLTELLERKARGRIKATKLLYRYDPLNKNNFHRYFDSIEHVVIVVRLANGFVMGAWSQGSFVHKVPSKKDGLLFSLTNRKAFELLQANTRAITYDEYYIIFGNAELRIKNQEKKAFSNFGVNNGFFRNLGENVGILFGSGGAR